VFIKRCVKNVDNLRAALRSYRYHYCFAVKLCFVKKSKYCYRE
jgi:hypothetical protein